MASITGIWLKFITNIFKIPIIIRSFDLFDLLISIPYETLILLYCNIFITYIHIHINKFVDNACCLLEKQNLQLLLNYETLVFHLKVNYHLIQILFL